MTEGEKKQPSEQTIVSALERWLGKCPTRSMQERVWAYLGSKLHEGSIPCAGPPQGDPRPTSMGDLALEQRESTFIPSSPGLRRL